jgi:uncharacterized membrane protein YraQ (UPF0718 family)
MKGASKPIRKGNPMLIPTIVMALVAAALVAVGIISGKGQHIAGVRAGAGLLIEVLPMLCFAFIVAGMVQVLLPKELLSRWVGAESGIKGILVGTLAGAVSPGGPYVNLPVVAGLLKAGASPGTMVAFLTAWSLWALARIPMEVGILGWKFTVIRFASTFLFAPAAGIVATVICRWRFGG